MQKIKASIDLPLWKMILANADLLDISKVHEL
jgi:hypothetical protein